MLGVNLLVKHDLALLLLLGELLQHDFSVVALSLQLMLQLHCHLSLSLLELVLLVGVSDPTTLDFVLELEVLLVYAALLSQDVKDVLVTHRLLILEVCDARLSDRDIDIDEVRLLFGLHSFSLSPLCQIAVITLSCLHILLPGVRQDLVVQNLNVLVQALSLFLELFLLALFLGLSELALLDGAIRDQVFTFEL